MTIEVFRTNVEDGLEAGRIIEVIHQSYEFYKANFDLQIVIAFFESFQTTDP